MNSSAQLPNSRKPERSALAIAIAFCVFLAIAVFFLWQEHRAHGLLPILLLLLCLLTYAFMHRGHGGQSQR